MNGSRASGTVFLSGYALQSDPAEALAQLCSPGSLFRQVLHSAPLAIFYLDRERIFRFADGVGMVAAANAAQGWVGRRLTVLFPDHTDLFEAVERAFNGEALNQVVAVPPQFLETHLEPVTDADGQVVGVFGTAANITEQHLNHHALYESEQRFKAVFAHTPVGVLIQSLAGDLLDCNPAIQEMLNLGCQEISSRDFFAFFLPKDSEIIRREYTRLSAGEISEIHRDVRLLPEGSEPLWGRLTASLVRDDSGAPSFITCLVENIHKEHTSADENHEVQQRLVQGREQERLALAQELHDGPLQEIIGITYTLDGLGGDNLPPADREQLQGVSQALDQLIHEIRQICGELRPPTLAPFGLEKAIRSHAHTFQEKHPELQVFLNLERDDKRLSERIRIALYRIYQESLTNVMRHANAAHVWIWLTLTDEQVALEIQDDGQGFELPRRWVELVRQGHLGLAGAIERSEAINGQFSIESQPGQGTLVRVTAPYTPIESEGNPKP